MEMGWVWWRVSIYTIYIRIEEVWVVVGDVISTIATIYAGVEGHHSHHQIHLYHLHHLHKG